MARLKDIADIFFKLALAAILCGFLYVYAASRDIGRYSYIQNGDLEYVMDSATGVIYQGGYSMNHVTGEEGGGSAPAPGK